MIKEQPDAAPQGQPWRKRQFVAEFKGGQPLEDIFVLAQASRRQARNGPFWSLLLQDATGQAEAKMWSPQSLEYPDLKAGGIIHVSGRVQLYQDRPQVVVEALRPVIQAATCSADAEDVACPDPDIWPPPLVLALDLADLVPTSAIPPERLLAQLEELLREQVQYPAWKRFIARVLGDPAIRARLLTATGAKTMHHAYVGGLLEHSLAVARLCLAFSELYPDLDRDILLTAAAFHDLGKAWELVSIPACDYTSEGRLLGHIHLGLHVLEPHLQKMKLDADLAMHFKHLLLAHHGEHEYGSPKRPKTAEAFALHYADNLDAKMNQHQRVCPLPTAEEGEPAWPIWSEFQRGLDRQLCRPRPTPGQGTEARKAPPPKENQCSLLSKA